MHEAVVPGPHVVWLDSQRNDSESNGACGQREEILKRHAMSVLVGTYSVATPEPVRHQPGTKIPCTQLAAEDSDADSREVQDAMSKAKTDLNVKACQ